MLTRSRRKVSSTGALALLAEVQEPTISLSRLQQLVTGDPTLAFRLLALVNSGLARDDAYRRVQRHALRAWDEELDFRELVASDAEIAEQVDLDAVFELGAFTRHVDTIFDRLNALRREPAHA